MKDLLEKTQKGLKLEKDDYNRLLVGVGLKVSGNKKLAITLLSIIFVSMTLLGILQNDYILAAVIFGVFLLIVYFILSLGADYESNFELYLKAIDEFYDKKLISYNGFFVFRTTNRPNITVSLVKDTVFFLSNGYDFIIFDDFLQSTGLEIKGYSEEKNTFHVFKILDQSTINNKPITFTPEDIISYFEVGNLKNLEVINYNYKDHTRVLPLYEFKNCVQIDLKDRRVLRLGKNVLEILRSYVPTKEVKK